MHLPRVFRCLAVVAFAGGLSSIAGAQTTVSPTLPPLLDRWMYPFGGTPGQEITAAVFRTPPDAVVTPGVPAFDDRDADVVVAFATAPAIKAGRGRFSYTVNSARLTLTTSNPPRFEYDPTFDSVRTSYASTDPQFEADSDIGKPVEVFAAGFRNGLGPFSFQETTPFSFANATLEGVRNVFPALTNAIGTATTDVSNQVRDRFEAVPMAVGQVAGLSPGALVPQDSTMTFDLDLSQPGTLAYVQRALDQGRLFLVVSSLHLTTGGPGGGPGSPNYPAFYMKEHPVAPFTPAIVARLDLNVTISDPIDFNNDGIIQDPTDLEDFLSVYSGGPCSTGRCADLDFNNDGIEQDPTDIEDFLSVYSGGPCSTGNC